MSSFKAQIEGSDEVFTFTIQHDATVFNACKVVKAEFEAEEDVVASIFGMKLPFVEGDGILLFVLAPGAFIALAYLMVIFNKITAKTKQ